jgi:hypothetical protein
VNVAAVIQVSPPSSSFQSLVPAAQSSVPKNPVGTFASLVDGLVAKGQSTLLDGLLQEMPADRLTWDGSRAASRPTSKDSRIGDTGGVPTKKNELKPKAGLAQTPEMVQPVFVQAPVLFRALIWGNLPAASETSGNEPQGDGATQVAPEDTVAPITVASLRTVASLPIESDPAPTSTLAFGLRLTPVHVETSPVSRSLLESEMRAGLGRTINAATDNAEANLLPSQVLAVSFLATHPGHSIPDQSAPRGGDLSASELPSQLEEPSPAKSTSSIVFSGLGNDSANNLEGLAETLSGKGDLASRMESLHLSNGPVLPPAETRGTQPDPSSNDVGASQESNMGRGFAPSEVEIAQFADPSILPDSSGNQRLISKNIGASTSPAGQHAGATGDAAAPKEVRSTKAQQQRLVLESDNERPSPITLRTENGAEPDRDQRTARAGSEQAEQPVPAPGELDASKARSATDGADFIKLQAAKSQTTTPEPITSQTTTAQTTRPQLTTSQNTISAPAASNTTPAQATASQTTPSGEVSHGAPSSKTTAGRATDNAPMTNQAMTNLESSQVTASPAETQSTTEHSASPSTNANEIEVNSGSQPQAARQISLKLTGEDATKVSVDVSERGGKVQIAVRSSDPELARSLRTDLGDLVGRLESRGFKTEAWVPMASRHTAAGASEQSSSNNSSGYSRDSGSGANQRQGRQGQNGSNQRQQARWIAQLKETISKDETRTETE